MRGIWEGLEPGQVNSSLKKQRRGNCFWQLGANPTNVFIYFIWSRQCTLIPVNVPGLAELFLNAVLWPDVKIHRKYTQRWKKKKGQSGHKMRVKKTADNEIRNRKQSILHCACRYILGEALSVQRETMQTHTVNTSKLTGWKMGTAPTTFRHWVLSPLDPPGIICWKSDLKISSSPWGSNSKSEVLYNQSIFYCLS